MSDEFKRLAPFKGTEVFEDDPVERWMTALLNADTPEALAALGPKPSVQAGAFDESLHPRDEAGRFAEGGSGSLGAIKPLGKRLSERKVLAQADRVVSSVGTFMGKDLSDVKVIVVPDYNVDARYKPEDRTIYVSDHLMNEARDPEFGIMPFRQISHEAMHAASGEDYVHKGISQTVEEGGAEVLSVAHWSNEGPAFDVRDSVGFKRDAGDYALARRSAYQDESAEVMRRAASEVGWDRQAVLDKVKQVFESDHNGRLDFRDSTDPKHEPPPGVTPDAVGLLQWLVKKE